MRYYKNSLFAGKLNETFREVGAGILSSVVATELFISKGIPYLAKRVVDAGRYYASEAMIQKPYVTKESNELRH